MERRSALREVFVKKIQWQQLGIGGMNRLTFYSKRFLRHRLYGSLYPVRKGCLSVNLFFLCFAIGGFSTNNFFPLQFSKTTSPEECRLDELPIEVVPSDNSIDEEWLSN